MSDNALIIVVSYATLLRRYDLILSGEYIFIAGSASVLGGTEMVILVDQHVLLHRPRNALRRPYHLGCQRGERIDWTTRIVVTPRTILSWIMRIEIVSARSTVWSKRIEVASTHGIDR